MICLRRCDIISYTAAAAAAPFASPLYPAISSTCCLYKKGKSCCPLLDCCPGLCRPLSFSLLSCCHFRRSGGLVDVYRRVLEWDNKSVLTSIPVVLSYIVLGIHDGSVMGRSSRMLLVWYVWTSWTSLHDLERCERISKFPTQSRSTKHRYKLSIFFIDM